MFGCIQYYFYQVNYQGRQHVSGLFRQVKGYPSPRQLMTLYWAFILDLLSPQKSIVFHYRVRLGH